MSINAIFGALIAAAILAAFVFGLDRFVMPYIDPYIPKELKPYKYIVVGLLIVLVAGFLKLGSFGKYIVDAGQVFMVLGFVDVYSGFMAKKG